MERDTDASEVEGSPPGCSREPSPPMSALVQWQRVVYYIIIGGREKIAAKRLDGDVEERGRARDATTRNEDINLPPPPSPSLTGGASGLVGLQSSIPCPSIRKRIISPPPLEFNFPSIFLLDFPPFLFSPPGAVAPPSPRWTHDPRDTVARTLLTKVRAMTKNWLGRKGASLRARRLRGGCGEKVGLGIELPRDNGQLLQ